MNQQSRLLRQLVLKSSTRWVSVTAWIAESFIPTCYTQGQTSEDTTLGQHGMFLELVGKIGSTWLYRQLAIFHPLPPNRRQLRARISSSFAEAFPARDGSRYVLARYSFGVFGGCIILHQLDPRRANCT